MRVSMWSFSFPNNDSGIKLHRAYNDSQKTTAKFNLNVLKRINTELDADFNLANFEHHAVYDEEKGRIEMYLRSLSEQYITIQKSELSITLSKGELIHTENSHKFSIPQIDSFLKESNFEKLDIPITLIGKTTSSKELVLYGESHTRIKLNSGYKHF